MKSERPQSGQTILATVGGETVVLRMKRSLVGMCGWGRVLEMRFFRAFGFAEAGVSMGTDSRELRSRNSFKKSGGVGSRSNIMLQGASMLSMASRAASSNAPGVDSAKA